MSEITPSVRLHNKDQQQLSVSDEKIVQYLHNLFDIHDSLDKTLEDIIILQLSRIDNEGIW